MQATIIGGDTGVSHTAAAAAVAATAALPRYGMSGYTYRCCLPCVPLERTMNVVGAVSDLELVGRPVQWYTDMPLQVRCHRPELMHDQDVCAQIKMEMSPWVFLPRDGKRALHDPHPDGNVKNAPDAPPTSSPSSSRQCLFRVGKPLPFEIKKKFFVELVKGGATVARSSTHEMLYGERRNENRKDRLRVETFHWERHGTNQLRIHVEFRLPNKRKAFAYRVRAVDAYTAKELQLWEGNVQGEERVSRTFAFTQTLDHVPYFEVSTLGHAVSQFFRSAFFKDKEFPIYRSDPLMDDPECKDPNCFTVCLTSLSDEELDRKRDLRRDFCFRKCRDGEVPDPRRLRQWAERELARDHPETVKKGYFEHEQRLKAARQILQAFKEKGDRLWWGLYSGFPAFRREWIPEVQGKIQRDQLPKEYLPDRSKLDAFLAKTKAYSDPFHAYNDRMMNLAARVSVHRRRMDAYRGRRVPLTDGRQQIKLRKTVKSAQAFAEKLEKELFEFFQPFMMEWLNYVELNEDRFSEKQKVRMVEETARLGRRKEAISRMAETLTALGDTLDRIPIQEECLQQAAASMTPRLQRQRRRERPSSSAEEIARVEREHFRVLQEQLKLSTFVQTALSIFQRDEQRRQEPYESLYGLCSTTDTLHRDAHALLESAAEENDFATWGGYFLKESTRLSAHADNLMESLHTWRLRHVPIQSAPATPGRPSSRTGSPSTDVVPSRSDQKNGVLGTRSQLHDHVSQLVAAMVESLLKLGRMLDEATDVLEINTPLMSPATLRQQYAANLETISQPPSSTSS